MTAHNWQDWKHCMRCTECRTERKLHVKPQKIYASVIPGSSRDTQAFRDHMNWDRDLNAYKSSRQGGLQPEKTTKEAVEAVERKVESQQRAIDKLSKQGDVDVNSLRTVQGVTK